MAIGADVSPGVAHVKTANGSPGSVRSNWATAYDDATTASDAADLYEIIGIDNAEAHRVVVPAGATRVLVRLKYDVGTDTFTTQPVIQLYGMDAENQPMRIDNADANATGFTLTAEASTAVVRDGSVAGTNFAYSNVSTLDGYDLKGSTYLYVTVETAADIDDGGVATAAIVQVLFLN